MKRSLGKSYNDNNDGNKYNGQFVLNSHKLRYLFNNGPVLWRYISISVQPKMCGRALYIE